VADALHEVLRSTRNPGRYSVYELEVDGVAVTVLSIERRREGFSQTPDGRVLQRRGAHNYALYGPELAQLVSRTLRQRYEATETSVPLSEAAGKLIDRVVAAYRWETRSLEDRLTEIGLVYGDNPPRLTLAGALLLLPNPESVVAKGYVEVYRYPHERGDYDRRVKIGGSVIDQIERTAQFVLDELGTELVVMGLMRHEIPRLPPVVVREALANALAHRSYEMAGTPVRVELRPAMVVVRSPGGLVEPVTVDNIREQQAARNPDLIAVLRRFGLAEDAGRGVDVMEDVMLTEMLEAPRFEEDGQTVSLALPIQSTVTPPERAWIRELQSRGEVKPVDRLLLVHAARGEELTNSRAREILHADSTTARASLQRLRDLGYLEQTGQRGGARYRLDRSFTPPAGLRLGEEELAEIVESLAQRGPISNADVRAATGLDAVGALALLTTLVDDGRLIRSGERKGTRYVAAGPVEPGR
jgi:ATP-dependent DNA helicase RecG